MRVDRRDQQVAVAGPLIINFIVDHDLVFGLLQFHHLAEFVGLAGLTLADDFRRGLEQAEYLAFGARVAARRCALWSVSLPA